MRRSIPSRLQAVLVQRAAEMRAAPTLSERILWRELAGNRLGVAFRRQLPIGRYVVDFAAPSAGLIVEVDGGYHSRRAAADSRRDRNLARLGWRIVRLPEALVVRDIAEAVARVRAALAPQ